MKIRWRLTADWAEKQALRSHACGCANTTLTRDPRDHPHREHAPQPHARPPARPDPRAGLDPWYDTCTEAIAHGYGPYVQGVDPEYDWYIDGDNDGTVCE